MQQDHSSASSSNTSSSSSSTTTTNSSVTAATPTTTVTSSPISSTSSTRRLFRPSSSFAPCITSAHIRPNTNPNPILDYGSTSTDLPNPSSTHPAPPSSVALSSGLTSDDISSTPSEEALVSTESPGGRSYIPSIEDTISSPGVDTNTRYVCAQSVPSLIDYTSHQYAQVGGNKDVGRGGDEASYEHPERYHATDVSSASRIGKGERGLSIPVVADTIPPPHRSYHRTSSEEGHTRGEGGGDGDHDGQVRSRKAEAIRNQDVSRLKMLPPDDVSSSSSAPSSSSSSSPPSPSSFAFPSSAASSSPVASSPFETPSSITTSTSTNSDSTFISSSISTSSPRPLARVHLISPDIHSSSASPSHRPSLDHIPSPLAGRPTTSGRTTFYLPHFLTGLRPYSQSRGNNTTNNNSSNTDTGSKPLPSILQPSPISNTLSENIEQEDQEEEEKEEDEDPKIIVTEVKSINFRDITTIPTTTFGHRRPKRRKSSSSHSSSPFLHPTSFEPSSSSSSSTSGSARRKRAKKSTSIKAPWNLCTPSCDCSRSKDSSSANLERALPKASSGSHNLLPTTQPMESTGRIRTHSETDVQVSESISSSHLVNASSGTSESSKNHRHHRHHQHHRRHRHSSSSKELQQQPEQEGRSSSTTPYSDSRAFNITQDSSHTIERDLYHEEKCIHHRRDDHYPHHKRQRSPPSMPFESSIPSPSSNVKLDRTKRARHLTSSSHEDTSIMDEVENMDVQELAWQDLNEDPTRGHRSRAPMHDRNTSRLPLSGEHSQELSPNSHHTTSTEDVPSQRSTIQFSKGAIAMSTKGSSEGTEPSIHPFDTAQPTESTLVRTSTPVVTPMPSRPSHHPPKETSQVSCKHPDQAKSQSHDETPSRRTKSGRISSAPLSRSGPSQPVAVPPPLTLPITRDTLRELDLFEIFKNPQLRHDIVFDPHLQFRPNFDGERGMIKKREADRFWREVELELNTRQTAIALRREAAATMISLAGLASSSSRLIQQQQQQKCPLPTPNLLPKLIDELREILLSLLPVPPPAQDGKGPQPPNPERALLTSTLDPELLLQELDHGVLDVHGLFRYLGDSLKGHCAPMRDAFVESMVAAVVQSGDVVRGIRMCFEILELMKLDIANHQLRTLRPWLLDNSIDFEQKYFTEQLARGGSLQRTQDWFKRSWIRWESVKQSVLENASTSSLSLSAPSRRGSLAPPISLAASVSSQSDLNVKEAKFPHPILIGKRRPSIVTADIGENILDGVVNEGLLDMILRPHGSVNTMPETFELDHYRLLSFHNDFQDLTILCTLLILFRQLARNCWTQQDLIEIKKVVWLLLTDENANFGVNTNTGSGKKGKDPNQSYSTASSGMKDIVIQIEFAARKVRERSANAAGSRRSSLAPVPMTPTSLAPAPTTQTSLNSPNPFRRMSTGPSLIPTPLPSPATTITSPSATTSTSGLSASDTNLLTSWLDNALSRTSTLYTLIQKRLMIHFRRWLYLHSSSSMLVLSASCASLASALSMSSGFESTNTNEDEDDTSGSKETKSPPTLTSTCPSASQDPTEKEAANPPVPEISPEEANKAAAEALASKLSFNTAEMEAHGLTGLEDEMTALLEKIRAVTEFNKKVYGTWYRDLVMQGRSENWLETPRS